MNLFSIQGDFQLNVKILRAYSPLETITMLEMSGPQIYYSTSKRVIKIWYFQYFLPIKI